MSTRKLCGALPAASGPGNSVRGRVQRFVPATGNSLISNNPGSVVHRFNDPPFFPGWSVGSPDRAQAGDASSNVLAYIESLGPWLDSFPDLSDRRWDQGVQPETAAYGDGGRALQARATSSQPFRLP